MKELDFDKLQEEFDRALADYDPEIGPRGLTSPEWAKIWGVSRHTAQYYLRSYVAEGIMEFVGRAKRIGIDGIARKAPVYAPVSTSKNNTEPDT